MHGLLQCIPHNKHSIKLPRVGFVIEYCEKGSLASYLQKHKGNISFEQKLHWLLHVAKGMRFLHSKNVIHRDLKCDNILIDANMIAKITDFGISKMKSHEKSKMTQRVGSMFVL